MKKILIFLFCLIILIFNVNSQIFSDDFNELNFTIIDVEPYEYPLILNYHSSEANDPFLTNLFFENIYSDNTVFAGENNSYLYTKIEHNSNTADSLTFYFYPGEKVSPAWPATIPFGPAELDSLEIFDA